MDCATFHFFPQKVVFQADLLPFSAWKAAPASSLSDKHSTTSVNG